MKQLLYLSLYGILLISCGENPDKKAAQQADTTTTKNADETPKSSADYSSLLMDYQCDIDILELSKVLKVPQASLSLARHTLANNCKFNLKGFGAQTLTGETTLNWGPSPSSKAQNKKEIKSYLERKKDGIKIMGMDIQLAETGDCYLAYQPAHGRIIIYNENYDTAFLLHYGQRKINNVRTKEQHEALRLKMTDLANYLLKKHKN